MTIASLLLFAATELFLSISPGPATLLAVSQGMRSGFRGSLFGALGVMTGEIIYFTLSAVGLGTVLLASGTLFQLIKWAGAAYLVYLGLQLAFGSGSRQQVAFVDEPAASQKILYRQGLLMQLANPKAILFFTALLPQFIDPQSAAAPQFLVLGFVSMAIQFPTLALYGWLAEKGGQWLGQSRYARWVDRIAGAFLIGAGIKLALARR